MSLIARLRRHVALRLTAAVGLGLAAVTLAIGAHVVISEQRELQTAVTAETLLLTRSVQIAFENAIRDRQLQDIDAMLVELEAIDPGTDIYLLGAGGTIVARSQGAGPAPSVATDGSVHFIDLADGGQTAAMHVKLGKSSYGYEGLIVARPLHAMLEDLRHTRLRVLLTVIASIAASTVLLLMVFRRSVEEPLARMTRAMRRFRQDGVPELQAPFADDEVGSALSEFAVLAHDLHEARGRIERQQQERAALEHHLVQLDKLATLGQLSARLAHEIGSPLQILEGRLSALKRELGADAASARLVTIALEQTQRITRVVSQILNVARPAPTMSFECEPGRAAAQIAEFLEMEAKRRGVKLDIDVSEAPRRVAVDADHISQIVLNLVRNALEATPSGGKVTLSLHNGRGPTGDELRIRVQDTGGGIREEDRERIFEPFFTTRGEGEGTGLGLSIVRSLVRRYGGSITFTSPPGQGSCFDVAIPLSRANDAVTNDEVDPEVNEEVHHD